MRVNKEASEGQKVATTSTKKRQLEVMEIDDNKNMPKMKKRGLRQGSFFFNGGSCEAGPSTTMKILVWNCRGLGNPQVVPASHLLVR